MSARHIDSPEFIAEVKTALERAEPYRIRDCAIGEMLLEGRTQCDRLGKWEAWVRNNLHMPVVEAYWYMDFAGHPKDEVEALSLIAKYARKRAKAEEAGT